MSTPELKRKKTGGARPGAGRKKGGENLATKVRKEAVREAVEEARAEGITPLEYMLKVMRDVTADNKRRDAMAAAAASYMHPRLSNTTVNVNQKRTVEELSTDDLIAALQPGRNRSGTAEAEEGNGKPH
jgi:hypothetical protein